MPKKISKIFCEIYNPFLFFYTLSILHPLISENPPLAQNFLIITLNYIALCYLLRTLFWENETLKKWEIKYSTHTGFAFSFITSFFFIQAPYLQILLSLFLIYLILIVLLQYHNKKDIFFTLAILILPLILLKPIAEKHGILLIITMFFLFLLLNNQKKN